MKRVQTRSYTNVKFQLNIQQLVYELSHQLKSQQRQVNNVEGILRIRNGILKALEKGRKSC